MECEELGILFCKSDRFPQSLVVAAVRVCWDPAGLTSFNH